MPDGDVFCRDGGEKGHFTRFYAFYDFECVVPDFTFANTIFRKEIVLINKL